MPRHFFLRSLPCVTGTPPQLLRHVGSPPALSSTPRLGFFLFFECIGNQLFNSHTCDLRDAMPHQRSLTLTLTLISREAEDFPRGDNHSKHVPLPKYLACLQPIHHNSRFGFMHVNIGKAFTWAKTLIKNIEQQPH